MRIIPLGGAGEVGRSSFLIKAKQGNVLLDHGVKLHGLEKPQYPFNPFSYVKNIDLILISHGHLDHIGYLPDIYRENRKIPWYSTPPTYDIGDVLWKDSIKLAKLKGLTDHYSKKAVEKTKINWHPALFNSLIRHGLFKFRFYDAGHILGSAAISLELEGKRIVYTGDLGYRSLIQKPYENFGECDIIIIEGTYADKDHPPIEKSEKMLIELIKETIENKGQVLLPAFAVGRTQELIMAIYKNNLSYPVYLDGMGKDITRIYLKYPSYIENFERFNEYCSNIYFVESARDRKKALNEPSIIITTAGMLDGGPVLNYILGINENSKIILTGFQVNGSNGYKLLNEGKVNIEGQEIKIKNEVHYLDMSAHVGKTQIKDAINMSNASHILLCHSELEKSEMFKKELEELGFKVDILLNEKVVDI
jgi:putative mRNA 3-end processing factor